VLNRRSSNSFWKKTEYLTYFTSYCSLKYWTIIVKLILYHTLIYFFRREFEGNALFAFYTLKLNNKLYIDTVLTSASRLLFSTFQLAYVVQDGLSPIYRLSARMSGWPGRRSSNSMTRILWIAIYVVLETNPNYVGDLSVVSAA